MASKRKKPRAKTRAKTSASKKPNRKKSASPRPQARGATRTKKKAATKKAAKKVAARKTAKKVTARKKPARRKPPSQAQLDQNAQLKAQLEKALAEIERRDIALKEATDRAQEAWNRSESLRKAASKQREIIDSILVRLERKERETLEKDLRDNDHTGAPLFRLAPTHDVHLATRPSAPTIRNWAKRRRHKLFWRDHDGSYTCICTFYGDTAWKQLERAANSIPGPAICYLRFLVPVENIPGMRRGKSPTPLEIGGSYWMFQGTPGARCRTRAEQRASKWGDDDLPWTTLMQFVPANHNPRRVGLVVRWAPRGGWRPEGSKPKDAPRRSPSPPPKSEA